MIEENAAKLRDLYIIVGPVKEYLDKLGFLMKSFYIDYVQINQGQSKIYY